MYHIQNGIKNNMKNLSDYIMVIDDCIDLDSCNSLMTKFDSCEEVIKRDASWEKDYRSFYELNISRQSEFEDETSIVYEATKSIYKFYEQKCGIEFFPQTYGFEDARMKRYDNNDHDQIGWHTDVGDYVSARRYLVMFYYLNAVEEGGETVFEDKVNDKCLSVKPKPGRVVVFPSMWMYPHKGMKPISNQKYIISTYAHYQ